MLSAPWIRSPLAAGGTRVFVDGCVPAGSTMVRVSVNGIARPDQPATTESVLILTPPLSAGDRLTVQQGDGAGWSASSSELVVQAVPKPLTAPVFETRLYTTSRGALLTHLVPGATVTLLAAGAVIGQATSDTDSVVVPFSSPKVALPPNSVVAARMTYGGQTSMTVGSPLLVAPSPLSAPRTPAAPTLHPALECSRTIPISQSYPGATVTLDRAGQRVEYLMPAESTNLVVERINAGDVIGATQRFDIQEWNPSAAVTSTAQAQTPAAPSVNGSICPAKDSDLLVRGVGGATIHLRATGSGTDILTGMVDPATGECRLRVPAGLTSGATTMDVVQQLCSRVSAATNVPVLTGPPVLPGQPHFVTNLYGCGRIIAAAGLTANTEVTVMSQLLGPIGHAFATGPTGDISVSPLLVPGDVITIVGDTCSGPFGGQEHAQVQVRPAPSLKFGQETYWVGDTGVSVAGITPGSRIDLFVDDVLAGSADVAADRHDFVVPALAVGQNLLARQTECGGPSDLGARSGPVLAKGTLDLKIATTDRDSELVTTTGVPTLVLAAVTDAVMHTPIQVDVKIPGVAAPIPSNVPTSITVAASAGTGNLSCETADLTGYLPAIGTLPVLPPMKVVNTQPELVITGSALTLTFSDDASHAQHPVPSGLSGSLVGVGRRTGPVTATMAGTVTYHLANDPQPRTASTRSGDDTFTVGPSHSLMTVWVNHPESEPFVDFTTT